MWFLFGFITLISFSIYFGVRRYRNSWKGTSQTSGQLSFEYKFEIDKGETKKFRVGVKAPAEFDFSFKRETSVDRFCKWLGLSVEHQVGRDTFDNLVYIVSNDGHLLQEVVGHHSVIAAVSKLFTNLKHDCKVAELRCAAGRLTATVEVGRGVYQDESELYKLKALLPVIGGWLDHVAQHLAAKPPGTPTKRRDRFIVRASVLLALSSGLLVNGGIHGYRLLFWSGQPFTVDTQKLWTFAALGGVGVVVLMVLVVVSMLGRSARTHLVLIEILLAGSVGATLTIFSEIHAINMEMDSSQALRLISEVTGKTTTHSRKGGTSYYVKVRDWNDSQATQSIKVSGSFYASVQPGQSMVFYQHEGALGIRWVNSYEALPTPWGK